MSMLSMSSQPSPSPPPPPRMDIPAIQVMPNSQVVMKITRNMDNCDFFAFVTGGIIVLSVTGELNQVSPDTEGNERDKLHVIGPVWTRIYLERAESTLTARNTSGAVAKLEYYAYYRDAESPTRFARVILPDSNFQLAKKSFANSSMETPLGDVDVTTRGKANEVKRSEYMNRDMQREWLISAIPDRGLTGAVALNVWHNGNKVAICQTNFERDIWLCVHLMDSEEKENTESSIELENLSSVSFDVGCQSCATWDDSGLFSVPHKTAEFVPKNAFDPVGKDMSGLSHRSRAMAMAM